MRIAFIGLGNMGGSMALNLMKAGHTLIVYDVRKEAGAPHVAQGAKWAESVRDAASQGELILTSLPGPPEVEAVALGPSATASTSGGPGSDVRISSPWLAASRTLSAHFAPCATCGAPASFRTS